MADKSYKQWEMELFGNIDRRCAKNLQIIDIMENIDNKIEYYHLSEMKEEDIKLEATDIYDRECNYYKKLCELHNCNE